MRRALALALLLVVSFSANATLITLDPDDYAPGTDLSNIAPGLTLRALSQPSTYPRNPGYVPTVAPVVARDCGNGLCGDYDGEHDFGRLLPSGAAATHFGTIENWYGCAAGIMGSYCRDGYSVLEMVFDNPTDFLQLETAWGSVDPAAIMAFNSAGERLFYCTALNGCPEAQVFNQGYAEHSTTFIVERASQDIARVVFGGFMGGAHLGEITYRVPEPGTLALLSLGLFGMRLTRRRKV